MLTNKERKNKMNNPGPDKKLPQPPIEWKEKFSKQIYGEDDALFDRAGNNVSQQVENCVQSLIDASYKRGKMEVLESLKIATKEAILSLNDEGFLNSEQVADRIITQLNQTHNKES